MAEIALRSAEINRAAYTRQLARDRNALELLLGQPLTPELSRRLNEAVTLTEGAIPTTLPADYRQICWYAARIFAPPSTGCVAQTPE